MSFILRLRRLFQEIVASLHARELGVVVFLSLSTKQEEMLRDGVRQQINLAVWVGGEFGDAEEPLGATVEQHRLCRLCL